MEVQDRTMGIWCIGMPMGLCSVHGGIDHPSIGPPKHWFDRNVGSRVDSFEQSAYVCDVCKCARQRWLTMIFLLRYSKGGLDIAGNQFSYDELPPFLFQLTNLGE